MNKFLNFFFIFAITQCLFSQKDLRLVIPIGHNNGYLNNKIVSSDSSFLYSTEDSLLIIWDLLSKRELFRKQLSGGEVYEDLVYEDVKNKELIFKNSDILRKVNFELNLSKTLEIKHSSSDIIIENTPLYVTGNRDSIALYDLEAFNFIAEFHVDINDIFHWRDKVNQSENLGETSVLLIKPKEDQHFLLVYNPTLVSPMRKIKFEFGVKKVFLIDESNVLIQKDEPVSKKDLIAMYKMDLKSGEFSQPIPFHNYTINNLTHANNSSIVSSGNDGRVVFWDSNLVIQNEFNVKKKFGLPSLVKIEIDELGLHFKAIRGKNKPNQGVDSVIYKGWIDLATLKLKDVDTINLNLSTDSIEEFNETPNWILGVDRTFNYYSNKDQQLVLYSMIDTIDQQILTINSDFQFTFEKLSEKIIPAEQTFFEGLDDEDFDLLTHDDQVKFFRDLKAQSKTSIFLEENFIDQLQTQYTKQKKKKKKEVNKKWQLQTVITQPIDTVSDYTVTDSLYYGKKLVFSEVYQKYDSSSRTKLESLGKNMLAISTLYNDSSRISLLNKRGVSDQLNIPDYHLFYKLPRELLYLQRQFPNFSIDFEDIVFLDHINQNFLNYFITYPGMRIQYHNKEKKEELFVSEDRFWQLKIEGNKFKFEPIDTLFKYDYLSQNPTKKYIFNSPYNQVFYDFNQTKMMINPRAQDLKITVEKNGQEFNYFLPKIESSILLYNRNYNAIQTLFLLKELDDFEKYNEFYYDIEEKAIFSKSLQTYYGKNLTLNSNEEFIGCFLSRDLYVVLDKSTNFFQVRNFSNLQLFSFVILDSVNYLFFDSQFHFDGTPEAIAKLYLTCGLEIIELAQIKDTFYLPNLVQRILNGENFNHLPKLEDLSICDITPNTIQQNDGRHDERRKFKNK